jgi:hypothetical protein
LEHGILGGIQNPCIYYDLILLLILVACLVLPCLSPMIVSLIKAIVEIKMASHVMMPWKYKPLNQDDAL